MWRKFKFFWIVISMIVYKINIIIQNINFTKKPTKKYVFYIQYITPTYKYKSTLYYHFILPAGTSLILLWQAPQCYSPQVWIHPSVAPGISFASLSLQWGQDSFLEDLLFQPEIKRMLFDTCSCEIKETHFS